MSGKEENLRRAAIIRLPFRARNYSRRMHWKRRLILGLLFNTSDQRPSPISRSFPALELAREKPMGEGVLVRNILI